MINQHTILVIDDEPSIREMLTIFLEEMGYLVETADTVRNGIAAVDTNAFDLVMCDLRLPDGTGLEVLEHAQKNPAAPPFIIITAHTTPQNALDALRAGASEYLSKPFNVEDLRLILRNLLGAEPSETAVEDSGLIGSSRAIQKVLSLVGKVAATPSTVLISGESGTGKELLARAIHNASPVASGPFLSINCGAMPENLLESELFGHVKGSFTGAVRDHLGLFAQAENGTILLDEVGDMTPSMQVKLLRVLQERRIRPVGGHREIEVSARVLAATNRDLAEEVRLGKFREDLFYRL
ncbi:MAG: sigma-54-dependent Fis family transcriptional regulator, partial [Acidobacteria bacterium]|nr:sigma-54-dependent Fis family transcriptional regulator [Acidobacteriota bacterium]